MHCILSWNPTDIQILCCIVIVYCMHAVRREEIAILIQIASKLISRQYDGKVADNEFKYNAPTENSLISMIFITIVTCGAIDEKSLLG